MNYLLDTSTFIWLVTKPNKLPKNVQSICANSKDNLYLSSVSCWEIAQKFSKKKLNLPDLPSIFIPEMRMEHNIYALPLEEKEALRFEPLPQHHNDPADRLLICQAMEQGMPIITNDKLIRKYDVETIW